MNKLLVALTIGVLAGCASSYAHAPMVKKKIKLECIAPDNDLNWNMHMEPTVRETPTVTYQYSVCRSI